MVASNPNDLLVFFQKVVDSLLASHLRFALAGGFAAMLYRREIRATKDLDFLLWAESKTEEKAIEILKTFHLVPAVVREADLVGGPRFAIKKKNSPICIVGGRPSDSSGVGLDFLLPGFPWFSTAVTRAEQNIKNIGGREIPCLTREDLIISKFQALAHNSTRFTDLDDLKEFFVDPSELDLAFISDQMHKYKIVIPPAFEKLAPISLQKISKKILKSWRHPK